ncbi:carbon-nitrogen hydrolase family protein [Pseudoalteromonas sp. SMS1]|uniref:carbon-nitrogen hydrolase family protein n=1 Tax=Pseudoalteromonas sp. SMS1 TaxID=2908894 RepID=UPI001F43BEFE|nr:carbon-nitrogen hydrolase family protein [Pseudoalteromonas sp. SMS1]MCF2860153.1 carbon-nitrogen hydrolase family protein [Pseudoalteromonas sp. SMS1]
MKLAVAQSSSVRGDVAHNIENHLRYIREASKLGVQYLVFPELSLSGYEPDIAKGIAFELNDPRLQPLVDAAKKYQITIGVGAPIQAQGLPKIGLFVFHQCGLVEVYEKMHLHAGEESYFSHGDTYHLVEIDKQKVANAICADTVYPVHARACAKLGATVYIAGVLVTPSGYERDAELWFSYASDFQMLVAIANYSQPSGGLETAGKSAIWFKNQLLAQADEHEEALVIAQNTDGAWLAQVHKI